MDELKEVIEKYVNEKPNPSFEEIVPLIESEFSSEPEAKKQAMNGFFIFKFNKQL